MEELHPERTAAAGEQRPLRPETDVPVGVEVQLVQGVGQLGRGRIVGDGSEFAGALDDVLVAERVGGRHRALRR